MLNLEKLEEKLNRALEEETVESLTEWLCENRKKNGRDCLIWKIKNKNNNGHRFIITTHTKKSTKLVEGRLNKEEYIDICITLSGYLEASVEILI